MIKEEAVLQQFKVTSYAIIFALGAVLISPLKLAAQTEDALSPTPDKLSNNRKERREDRLEKLKESRGSLLENRKERRELRREGRQEKRSDFLENRKERREGRLEKLKESRGSLLENRKERRELRREGRQKKRQGPSRGQVIGKGRGRIDH